MTYNVLVIGSGGREHAIVDALKRSESVGRIYCAPGNAGIDTAATPVSIPVTDINDLARFATDASVSLTVVGPEVPLAAGIVDEFRKRGLRIFGPTKAAAQIESSKAFAKELMARHNIPTAASRTFDDFDEALQYVLAGPERSVIKFDGMAPGKGVVVAQSHEEAEAALRNMLLDDEFGKGRVVVEEFLDGPEFSFMCLVNGPKVYPLAIARDQRRASARTISLPSTTTAVPTRAVWVHIHPCLSSPTRSVRRHSTRSCSPWPKPWLMRECPLPACCTVVLSSTTACLR